MLSYRALSFLSYRLLAAMLLMLSLASANVVAATFSFKADDGLEITADNYIPLPASAPLIVLFHQAGFSRGEYRDIAPTLNELGFNAIAIDQRAGKSALGIANQTAMRAQQAGLPGQYTDALTDIVSALKYARQAYPDAKIIAWGSSYSAALVLYIAGTQPQLLDAIMAFSPGEYFARLGKTPDWIQSAAGNIQSPAFITSARSESDQWAAIYAAIRPELRNKFIPAGAGKHGSKALWTEQTDSEAYWRAVRNFLQSVTQ